MNLERFIAALGPVSVVGTGDANEATIDIGDLAYDTRSVRPGSLFFCVRGHTVDGHAFARDGRRRRRRRARRRAAARPSTFPSSSSRTCAPRCRRRRRSSSATRPTSSPVAAVTGTNGKTTTAFLLHAILEASGRQSGLLTNIERRVGGTPAARG